MIFWLIIISPTYLWVQLVTAGLTLTPAPGQFARVSQVVTLLTGTDNSLTCYEGTMGNKLQILFPHSHFTFCFKLCLFQSGALSNDGGADQRPLHPADHHPGSPQQHDAQHRQPRGSGLQRDTWRSVTHCDHAMHNFKFWPFLKTKWLKPNVLHCIVTSTQCCDLCTQLVDWAENCCYCCGVQTSRDLSGGHWWPTLSLTSKLMFWLIQPLLSGRGTSSGS